jgi:hypothetical protein
MAKDLTEQGIELLRAGDKDGARSLLQQAVQDNPEDVRAWYHLAASMSSLYERRQALEQVLQLDPNHVKAKEQLAKLTDGGTRTAEKVADNLNAPTSGFKLPITIPDAPEYVTPDYLVSSFVEKFKNGLAILQRKPGIYAQEVQRATWWHFWSYVGIAYLISGIAGTISGAIVQAQLAAMTRGLGEMFAVQGPNPINILTTFILTIPVSIAVLFAGLKASHWYATNQANGQGSFVNHAYAIMIPATTVSIITSILTLVFTIIPFMGILAGLASIVLAIYALFVAADGIRMVHKMEGSAIWITLVVMIAAQIAAAILLGIVLSPFVLGSNAMAFM